MLPSEYKEQQEKCLIELKTTKDQGWEVVEETLTRLTRKRGLAKTVATSLVELVYEWTLEEGFATDQDHAVKVLTFLADLTEGKIFLEVIRARVLTRLADYREADGDLIGAKELLQNLQVEAFTTMALREKTEFILKQMRLILASKDYVRVQIASRKLPKTTLDQEELMDLKIKYYDYLLAYQLHEGNYLEAANCVKEIMDTPTTREDKERSSELFMSYATLLLLEGNPDVTHPLLNGLIADTTYLDLVDNAEPCKMMVAFVGSMVDDYLTCWPLEKMDHVELLQQVQVLSSTTGTHCEGGAARMTHLTKRVLEKNLRVLCKMYSTMPMEDIVTLTNFDRDDAESTLVEMIKDGHIRGKIDRSTRTITFGEATSSLALVDAAGISLSESLTKISSCVHQIERECMLQAQRSQ